MDQQMAAKRSRRRGDDLEHALYAATLAELTELGYSRLTMEGIAARARTGKAALYRRWPTKHALVLASLRHALPPMPEPPADRTPRQNLLAIFTAICDEMAGKTGSFPGLDFIGQVLHEPELRTMLAEDLIAPRLQVIESILRHAKAGGEIDPNTFTPLTARVGPALIIQHVLLTGAPPSRRELTQIIDTLVLPQPTSRAPATGRPRTPTTKASAKTTRQPESNAKTEMQAERSSGI